MRLFIGIEIDDAARAAVMTAARTLQDCVEQPEWAVGARWISAGNLHITLWFIGEVSGGPDEPGVCRSILEAMATPFETPCFTAELAGLGVFPPSGPPRVFWMGVRAGAEGLSALHAQVGERLRPLGFEAERRPYSAHLTLARVRASGRGRPAALRAVIGQMPAGPARFRVDAVTVFASRLSPKGASYQPILRVPLR